MQPLPLMYMVDMDNGHVGHVGHGHGGHGHGVHGAHEHVGQIHVADLPRPIWSSFIVGLQQEYYYLR